MKEDEGRDSYESILGEIQSLESLIAGWEDPGKMLAVQALKAAIDALHKEALSRMIKIFRKDNSALRSFKESASDPCVYLVLRHHKLVKPSLSERVELALENVRPAMHSHGGDIELVRVEGVKVVVRLLGSCDGCGDWGNTFKDGVEKAIMEACPEIEVVECLSLSKLLESSQAEVARFLGADYKRERWARVIAAEDLPDGAITTQEIEGISIIIFRRGDNYSCFQNACSHMQLPLSAGDVSVGVITCPFHGFQYDLATGDCLSTPGLSLKSFRIRQAGGYFEVNLD